MDRFAGLNIGLQSYSLRTFDTESMIKSVADLGLEYVELCGKHLTPLDESETQRVRSLCDNHGVKISAYGVTRIPEDRNEAHRLCEWVKSLDALAMNIDPDPTPEALDQAALLASQFDLPMGIHNHGPEHRWDTFDTVESAIADRSELLGACVDTGHFWRVPNDPTAGMKRLGRRVVSVHLKDMDLDEEGDEGDEFILGDGPVFDLKGTLELLRDWNFQGPISIEYEENSENPIDDLRVAIRRIEQALA